MIIKREVLKKYSILLISIFVAASTAIAQPSSPIPQNGFFDWKPVDLVWPVDIQGVDQRDAMFLLLENINDPSRKTLSMIFTNDPGIDIFNVFPGLEVNELRSWNGIEKYGLQYEIFNGHYSFAWNTRGKISLSSREIVWMIARLLGRHNDYPHTQCTGDIWKARLLDYTNPNTGVTGTFFVHPVTREGMIYKQWVGPGCNLDSTNNRCFTDRWQDVLDLGGFDVPAHRKLQCDEMLRMINGESPQDPTLRCEGSARDTRIIEYTNPKTRKKGTFFIHPTTRQGRIFKQWVDPSCNLDFATDRCFTGRWQDVLDMGGSDAPRHRKLQCYEMKQILD